MCSHIIRTFRGMGEQRIPVRYQPPHKALQIRMHIRIGILAQYQGSTGMSQEDVAQTGTDPGKPHLLRYGIGDEVAATSRGIQLQDMLVNHQLSHGPV